MKSIRFNLSGIAFVFSAVFLVAAFVIPVVAFADSASINEACAGLTQLPDGSCSNNGSAAISIATKGVKLLSIVAGIITVVMIIAAGFQYITSGGDAGKVTKAKTSLVYSIIGLAVVALSQFLVHFVLSNAT